MSPSGRYVILIKGAAEREMSSLPLAVFERITKAILALETTPRPPRAKKLQGRSGYRLRVGDYRVLYTVSDPARKVEIVAVGHRKDVYRG
jgi:mRNA interferase RelE/StbE